MTDWSYLWSLLSFFIGIASGFQGIYERFNKSSFTASRTFFGFFYLLSRGLVPALIFLGLYHFERIDKPLWLWAIGFGLGTEGILRSKLYIKSSKGKDGKSEDILKGGLDLLRWYQNLLMELAGDRLSTLRINFMKKHIPKDTDFEGLRNRVLNHLSALTDPQVQADIRNSLDRLHQKFQQEIEEGGDNNKLDERYQYELGYLILDKVGKKGFKTILSG